MHAIHILILWLHSIMWHACIFCGQAIDPIADFQVAFKISSSFHLLIAI